MKVNYCVICMFNVWVYNVHRVHTKQCIQHLHKCMCDDRALLILDITLIWELYLTNSDINNSQ